jgi:protein MAK11
MLVPILGLKCHGGSVRSICTSGRFAVSASADETMSVFDLAKVADLGQLFPESVGISAVAMYGGSHLITGSDDGRLAIFRTSDWEPLTSMPAHPQGVAGLAIHPSGRLALSVGKEPQLYTWNLMRAKCVLKRPLDAPASAVRWSPAGTGCALLCDKEVLVLDLNSEGFSARLLHTEKALAFEYLTDALLVSGGEDRALHLWDVRDGLDDGARELCSQPDAHAARIKGIVRLGDDLVCSASSDGSVKLWRLCPAAKGVPRRFEQVDGVELGQRITCLASSPEGVPTRKAVKVAALAAKGRARTEEATKADGDDVADGDDDADDADDANDDGDDGDDEPTPAPKKNAKKAAKVKVVGDVGRKPLKADKAKGARLSGKDGTPAKKQRRARE